MTETTTEPSAEQKLQPLFDRCREICKRRNSSVAQVFMRRPKAEAFHELMLELYREKYGSDLRFHGVESLAQKCGYAPMFKNYVTLVSLMTIQAIVVDDNAIVDL